MIGQVYATTGNIRRLAIEFSGDGAGVHAESSGGSAPNGGTGGSGGFVNGGAGAAPGAGGGGATKSQGGGSGAYASKTYASGALSAGSSISVVVGAGGAGGTGGGASGGAGAAGQVKISCGAPLPPPPPAPSCTLSAAPTPIPSGNSTTLTWTSTNATTASIDNGVGSVAVPNGSKSDSPPSSTTYTMTVTGPGGSATCSSGLVTVSGPPPPPPPPPVAACNFTGYAWSDTVGWISLGGPGYGFQMDGSGNISGYAWSDNIGWVQAGGLSGFPSGSGTVSSNATLSGTSIVGWLRALAGNAPPTNSQNGGWDGWISLGGSSPAYGVTRGGTGDLSGFAWGDMNVGWVDFSYGKCSSSCTASAVYTCNGQTIVETDTDASCNITTKNLATCSGAYFCSPGSSTCLPIPPTYIPVGTLTGHLQVFPKLVQTGMTTQVYWDISNVTNCSVTSTNGDSWPNLLTSGPSGKQSKPIEQQTTFTLSCTELNGAHLIETATVGVVPVFQEI